MTARFYYVETDSNGILCVGPVSDQAQTEEGVVRLARDYDDTIYFEVAPEYPFDGPSPDQLWIEHTAQAALDALAERVPNTTAHYAVEQARDALHTLIIQAKHVVTVDIKAARS